MWKKKATAIFIFFVVLFAASYMIESETRSSLGNNEPASVFSGEKEVSAYFFYGQECPHCKRVEPFIARVEHEYPLTIHKYEIYHHRDYVALLHEFFDRHGVSTERRGVPALFVSDAYLVGDEPILTRLEEVVSDVLKEDSVVVHTYDTEEDGPKDLVEESACDESGGNSECLSIATLTTAALVDSVSPCSLAVLLFLVGVRPLVSDRRKRALKVSLAFIFSVFVTYTLFGLGLLSVIGVMGLSSAFGVVAGLVAIIAGIFYVKDYFWHGDGGFAMEVPRSLRPLTNRMIKGVTSPLGAFLIGFAISCFELPCTGGPYLFILGQLANSATRLQAIPMLLYYNFLFILPLLLVSLLLYCGVFSLKRVREWNDSNKGLLRLVSGLTIIALGIVVMPSSELIGLIRMFLGGCKVVLPPVLFTLSFYLAFSFLSEHQMRTRRLANTILLVTLPVLSIFAYPLLFRNVTVDAAPIVGDPDMESDVSDFPSTPPPEMQSTNTYSETLCDSGDVACEEPDAFAGTWRDSVLEPEKTTELTSEERAQIEERAKLHEDETVDEAVEQESADETVPVTCDGKSPGMANPAAVYCIELGYEYKGIVTDKGQHGVCKFPDDSECEGWQFLMGKCRQEYSYCARQGYDLMVKADGKDPFSKEYAVCVHNGEEVGSVTDLFGLSEKATVGIVLADSENDKTSDELLVVPQAPSSFDWRNYVGQNWMTPVKDQNPCGSCWAFSAVGVVEALYNIYTNNPDLDLDLSEEYLVSDCDTTSGTCCGGWKDRALEYIRDNGIADESCFPYVDWGCSCPGDPPVCSVGCNYRTGGECSDATCSDRCSDWQKRLTKIDVVTKITSGDSAAMKERLIDKGPLAVSFGWGTNFGGYWDGDIYRCTSDTGTNHAVVLVGYNDAGGYWIIKNSWGDTWGPHGNGYFKLGYGECYIEQKVYYAEPDRKNCGETITSNTILVNDLACPGNGLIVGTSDITVDCQGFTIQGSGSGVGIDIDYNYVTIKNCIVRDFANGIYLHDIADYNTLYNNDVLSNEFHGIYLYDAWLNNITLNDVNYNVRNGLYFHDKSIYNDVEDNDFEYNGYHGIQLKGTSDYNDFSLNFLYGNGWSGMGIDTDNNLISGGWSRNNAYHGFHISSATGNTIQSCKIWFNDHHGIYLYNSTNTQVTNNNDLYRNDEYGVYSSYSNYTTIEDSLLDGNYKHGVYLYYSHHNTIQTNDFYQNYNDSIRLYYSDDNYILSNDIRLSGDGGLNIWYSNDNTIQFNNLTESEAYALYTYQSDYNGILNNRFEDNYDYSIWLSSSDNNEILHNIVTHPNDLGIYSLSSNGLTFENNTVCGYWWDFYMSGSTYTADEDTCDSFYQFADSGQDYLGGPGGCDFECSGCRKPENDLYADRDLTFCPGIYRIEDTGTYGIIRAANNGITLTCDGTILNGTGTGYGIVVSDGYDYVTVQNCELQNYHHGIVIDFDANYNNFINNNVISMVSAGIWAGRSQYNNLEQNTLTSNGAGIYIFRANYTTIRNNDAQLNDYGISISTLSYDNYLEDNTFCSNSARDIYNLGTDTLGDLNLCDDAYLYADNGQISDCDFECSGCRKAEDDLVMTENTQLCPYTYNIEDLGSLGVIIIGAHGVELDCQGAELIAVSTGSGYGIRNIGYENVTVRNCRIYNYFIAIDFMSGANYGNILNNDVSSNAAGIRLWGSNYGDITGNTANLNTQYGIILTQNSDFNAIRNNEAKDNSIAGVIVYAGSDNNVIELNHVASNYDGIYVHDSDNNYVHNNIVEDNTSTGVYFTSTANNNELHHNRICANSLDINDLDANFGDDNFCTTTSNYDDTGTTGCTCSCLLGDVNDDGIVDGFDFSLMGAAYRATPGDPNWNPMCDLDCNDIVDGFDFSIAGGNYRKTASQTALNAHTSPSSLNLYFKTIVPYSMRARRIF